MEAIGQHLDGFKIDHVKKVADLVILSCTHIRK